MLMDMFYETCEVNRPKRRMHFHELMVEVHQRLHAIHTSRPKSVVYTEQGLPIFRFGDAPVAGPGAHTDSEKRVDGRLEVSAQSDPMDGGDAMSTSEGMARPPSPEEPLTRVAAQLVEPGLLLCLDEMQVTDVADAMILCRLFELLIDVHGVEVVFTSNRPPEQLYERGLNRKYFQPFVDLVRERLLTLEVGGSVDYRTLPPPVESDCYGTSTNTALGLRTLARRTPGTFHSGTHAEAALRERWSARLAASSVKAAAGGRETTGDSENAAGNRVEDATLEPARLLPVGFGRTLSVGAHAGDAGWFTFDELCAPSPGGRPLGASDYHALARAFKEVYLVGVPTLTKRERNEARRLVILVDALYEARCTLHVAAAEPLPNLVAPLLEAGVEAVEMMDGAEVAIDDTGDHSLPFKAAAVGGKYGQDGELAAFFTAKDEVFMLRRTVSRITEMCSIRGPT